MASDVSDLVSDVSESVERIGRRVQLMEVCGTHTVSIFRHGLRSLLPEGLRLVSGPGCPVCVTAQRHIDAAIELARRSGVVIATYGDMVRVPGRCGSLEEQRGAGADVRVVWSARSALELAVRHPQRPVVFLAVGFETTAPATAAVVLEAVRRSVENFFILAAHKLVVPAMLALLEGGSVPLDGFLCPGHVSVVTGSRAYAPVVERFSIPCVIAGFEPHDIVRAIAALVRQVEVGEARIENLYPVAVTASGNHVAQTFLDRVFRVCDAPWLALGVIRESGLELRPEFEWFDALPRFGIELGADVDSPACRCGEVIQGKVMPEECELFGAGCTPLRPVGPCMVSSEGTCSAWYKYRAAMPVHRRPVGTKQPMGPVGLKLLTEPGMCAQPARGSRS